MGWMIQGSNHGGSKIFSLFSIHPDYLWGPLILCGAKWLGRGIDHPSHLAPRSKIGRARPVPLLCACINMLLDDLVMF
jgi:hypothetical protein